MAMDIAVRVYELTEAFPKREQYGLAQQLRRASVSISSNIAEGYGRKTHKQTFHFLENALGSAFEVETQLELATRLGFLDSQAAAILGEIKSIGKGLDSLMRYVERDSHEYATPRP